MPSLKDLNCAIELSESQQPLREFGTIYGDGFVETFVPVPSKSQSFSIHLTSNNFIAPGVAIFVYVDGVYQCNRNRQDLKLRKPSDSRSLVDFRVRQKEERQKDGSMIAREWAFDKLNIASAEDAPNLCSSNILDNIGCIEVVVLRCAGTRNAKSASTMNFDGAGDFPDHRFGLDDSSSPSNERSMYDDRGPFFTHFGNGQGPPPPVSSYHSPYAETLPSQEGSVTRSRRTTYNPQELFPPASVTRQSRPRSRYSEPVSPGARRVGGLPESGFQYGSGPIPRDGETYNNLAPSVGTTQPPGVDPVWLNNLLTTAVKQGVEESRRMETQSEGQDKRKENTFDAKSASQPPGAWPESPFNAPTLPYQQTEQPAFSSYDHQSDNGSNWAKSQPGWGDRTARSRAGTRVTWNAEPALDTESCSISGWNLRDATASDSWDTGDTWPTDRAAEWEASSQQGKIWVTNPPSHYHARSSSPVTSRAHDRRRSKQGSTRKSRSKSRSRRSRSKHDVTSSSEENGSWDHLERPSDSVVSLSSSDDTLQPSHSRSRTQPSRRRSKSRSRRSKSVQREHKHKSSRQSPRTPASETADEVRAPLPSVITRMTPTVMNAPPSAPPTEIRSRQPSAYSAPPASLMPAPEWGAAAHDLMRKPSHVPSTILPAPYAPSLKDFMQSAVSEKKGDPRSSASSSWGGDKKDHAVKSSWDKEPEKDTGWSKNSDSGWQGKQSKEKDGKGWYSTDDDKAGRWGTIDDEKKVEAGGAWNPKDTGWGKRTSSPKQERDEKMDEWTGLKSALKSAFEEPNPPAPEISWRDQSWTVPADNFVKTADIYRPTTVPFAAVPAPPAQDKTNAPRPSHRMSNKTLSRYRPNHPSLTTPPSPSRRMSNKTLSKYGPHLPATPSPTFAPIPIPQPHWQFPPPPSTSTPPTTRNDPDSPDGPYIAPAEPRLTISQKTSSTKGIEHAVRAGKATDYGHVIGRPEYLDGLEKPYAVFRFKYRSEGVLRGLGVVGEGDLEKDSSDGNEREKAERLKEVPQEELIKKMLELERKLKVKDVEGTTCTVGAADKSRQHSRNTVDKQKQKQKQKQRRTSNKNGPVGNTFTEQWVERHSRDPSVHAMSRVVEHKKKDKEKEVVGSWGKHVDDGWGGASAKW